MGVFKKVMALMLSLVMIASMSTTMVFAEGQAKGAGVSYVFGGFTRGGPQGDPAPVGISSLVYIADGDQKVLDIAIYDASKMIAGRHLQKNNFTTIDVADTSVCTLSYFNTPDQTEENASGIRIVPKKEGQTTLTATPKNGSAPIELAIDIQSIPVPETGIRIDLVGGKPSDDGGPTLSGIGFKKEQSTDPNNTYESIPICFKIFEDGKPMPIPGGAANGRIDLKDPKIKYTVNMTGTPEAFFFEELNNGEYMLRYRLRTIGKSTLSFDVIYNGKTYTTAPFTVDVVAPRTVVTTTLKPTDSINTALDAIRTIYNTDKETFAKNRYEIRLEDGTYAHDDDATLTLDIPVTIKPKNHEGNDLEKSPVTVKSSIVINMKDREACMISGFILEGRGKRVGTGITSGDNHRGDVGGGLAVRNFNIGVDNKDQYVNIARAVSDCNIGLSVAVLHERDVSVCRGGAYHDNDIAVQIKDESATADGYTTKNPFSFAIMYNNFENNKVHIQNNSSVPFNFSFNYFDDVSLTKFTAGDESSVLPLCSPYYAEKVIRFDNPPKNMKIMASELDKVQVDAKQLSSDTVIDKANFTVGTKISLVKPGEAVETLSGWNFTSINGGTTPDFKPAISTTLTGGSAAAATKIPDNVSYQPVSFAHHGALPGTAEVTVKETASLGAEVGAPLKLFKIVGNGLVLQPEVATLNANGELIFNRDSASDYVISSTDISTPDTTGNTGSDDDSSGSNDYTGADEVTGKLDAAPAGGSVSLDVSIKSNVSASVFAELAQSPGKSLVLRGDGYSWVIKGSDLLSPIAGLLAVNTTISGVSPNAEAIKAMTGDAVIQNLYFGYHGNLPFTATINVEVDPKLKGKSLNLYHIDGNLKNLMLMESGLVVKDGKVSFPVSSCSDYILTADTIPGALIGKKAIHNVTNPDTGAKDTVPLAVGIALMSVLGMAVLLKDDRKKK